MSAAINDGLDPRSLLFVDVFVVQVLKELNFPPKKWFGNLAQKTVVTRKAQLEQYIKSLLQLQPRPEDVSDFLEINAHAIVAAQTDTSQGSRVNVDDFELLKVRCDDPPPPHHGTTELRHQSCLCRDSFACL